MSTHAEELRWRIDEAIDEWLQANGLTGDEIADLDYQYVNEALDDLLDK